MSEWENELEAYLNSVMTASQSANSLIALEGFMVHPVPVPPIQPVAVDDLPAVGALELLVHVLPVRPLRRLGHLLPAHLAHALLAVPLPVRRHRPRGAHVRTQFALLVAAVAVRQPHVNLLLVRVGERQAAVAVRLVELVVSAVDTKNNEITFYAKVCPKEYLIEKLTPSERP